MQSFTSRTAIDAMLTAIDNWHPEKVALSDAELQELSVAAHANSARTTERPFAVPRSWLNALLAAPHSRTLEPVPLLGARRQVAAADDDDYDDDEHEHDNDHVYLSAALFRAVVRHSGSCGVWIDGCVTS